MKKLITFIAIVCASVVTQAAQIAWTTGSIQFCDATGAGTATMTGGQLVLVTLGSTIDWTSATVIPTGTGSGTTTVKLNTSTTASKTGRVTGQVSFDYTGSGSDLINNGDYLALMWQDDGGNLSRLLYTSGSTVGNEAVYQVSGLANNSSSLTGKAIGLTGNFKAPASGDVPEPTSGLLLVVGGALLALRRKQK